MVQVDETDLVYKGPWVRSAQQRLFQTLEADYSFPKATCRSLVNLMWDFLNETFGEKLHEGQITFYAASASEPPGKRLSEIKSVPVHLTFHDRNDMNILTEKGTSGLRKHKILRMSSEALDQDGLLTQEDLAVLLCSSSSASPGLANHQNPKPILAVFRDVYFLSVGPSLPKNLRVQVS